MGKRPLKESVQELFNGRQRGYYRPLTLQEIQALVDKAAPNVWKEVRWLMKAGELEQIKVKYDQKKDEYLILYRVIQDQKI